MGVGVWIDGRDRLVIGKRDRGDGKLKSIPISENQITLDDAWTEIAPCMRHGSGGPANTGNPCCHDIQFLEELT
jgi:hypothetical protein